jgi:hypothetical protein
LKLTFIQTPPVLPVERQNSELLRGFYCNSKVCDNQPLRPRHKIFETQRKGGSRGIEDV